MEAADVNYLCDAANRYFRERVETSDVVRTVAGANSVTGKGARSLRRDGTTAFDAKRGKAPLLMTPGKPAQAKYFGKASVTIPKKFHLVEIATTVAKKMKDFYSARFKSNG